MSQPEFKKPRNPLRDPQNMFEEDEGNTCFVRLNHETGEPTPHTISVLHGALAELRLNQSVPVNVVDQFDLARNLCLYGWYQYNFSMPAKLYGYIALEVGLREKCATVASQPGKRITLARLCDWAIDAGYIKDGGFTHLFAEDPETGAMYPTRRQDLTREGTTYSKQAFANTRGRNSLAHGSSMLMPPIQAAGSLRIIADAINLLFPD